MAKEKEIMIKNFVALDTKFSERSEEVTKFEKDIIKKYLSQVLPESDLSNITIELLNSNYFYDSFSISLFNSEDLSKINEKFVLKVSLDPENKKLLTEKNALEQVSDLISCELIDYRLQHAGSVEFLLTTWENGDSFDFFGIQDLLFNMGTFSNTLDFMHESKTENLQSFEDRFYENASIISIFDEVEPKELQIFEKLTDLNKDLISQAYLTIETEFKEKYKEDISVLCHSNLKKSNILYKDEFIKFINFENAHCADIYYSLLKVVNNLQLYFDTKVVNNFLNTYYKSSRVLSNLSLDQFQKKYKEKKEINRLLLFQDLLTRVLLHFHAYGAFYRTESLIHYMNLYLNLKPTVKKFFPDLIKSFDKLFLTPVPSIKTYDMEEIKMLSKLEEE